MTRTTKSPSSTESPRVAVIGGGNWGRHLVRNFHELGALAAVCDSDTVVRERIKSAHPDTPVVGDVEELLASHRFDGVAIATPAETHGVLARRFLEDGYDVFVEKPLCLSVGEGEALVDLAAAEARILMVGHLLWYHPAVLRLSELIRSGDLGRLQYIYSNRVNLGRIRREENILWSFAPHDLSVILGLVGENPERVSAHGGNYLHDQIADVTVTHLDFPSGVKAHVFVSWLHPFKEQKLVVVGDRRMAVFDDGADDKLVVFPHKIEWESLVPKVHKAEAEVVRIEAAEPLRLECQHFLDCVAGRVTPRTDGAEGLRVLRLLRVAQESLEKGGVPQAGSTTKSDSGNRYQVHESSYVDADVQIGDGTTIWHFSHLLSGSRLGRDCRIGQNVVIGPRVRLGDGVKIQNNVSVYEGVELEDAVFCGPSMVFTNIYNPRSEIPRMDDIRRTLVRRGASLGANCTLVCGVTIGEYAFVGAGAVVNRDVPDYAVVVGNPVKVIGWMCACGLRLAFNSADRSTCEGCGIMYTKSDDAVHPVSLDSAKTLTAK